MLMDILTYVLVAFVVLAIVFAKMSIVIISQSETKIIERLGKYYATLQPGINVIIPFIDHAKDIVALRAGRYTYTNSIDLREQVYDFDRQNVITKDNIQMQINALLYFQIVDPFKAVYEINNLPNAIEKLTQTTLRNIIGEMGHQGEPCRTSGYNSSGKRLAGHGETDAGRTEQACHDSYQ